MFSTLDKTSDAGTGYIDVSSRYSSSNSIHYGVVQWLDTTYPLNTVAEIITHDDLPTYMQFNTNNWAQVAKFTGNNISWGSELTMHKQIETIKLYLNSLTKKFWAGTRIVIFGVDKLNVD